MEFDKTTLGKIFDQVKSKLPVECIGVVVLGSTGVGKSTLVNAFFPDAEAKTGYGEPVTQEAEWFPKQRDKDTKFRILDSKGLEEKAYYNTVQALLEAVDEANRSDDRNDHAHVAWLAIKESSGRVQESYKEIAKRFTEVGIPVIVVLTEAIADNQEFKNKVRELLPGVKDVIPVNSIPKETHGGGLIPAFGLPELFTVTSTVVPEKSANALLDSADPSIISIEEKRKMAMKRVKVASAAAAAAGATPIPIADAAILVPIQAGMIVSVSSAYGMAVDKESSMALMTAVAAPVAATFVGRALFASILKFIPGLGSLAGALIGGSVASSLTFAIGRVYVEFLHRLCEKNGNAPPQTSQVVDQFAEFYKAHGGAILEALKQLKK